MFLQTDIKRMREVRSYFSSRNEINFLVKHKVYERSKVQTCYTKFSDRKSCIDIAFIVVKFLISCPVVIKSGRMMEKMVANLKRYENVL